MPPSFQQQLSAHASLLTSSHPHPLFQLTPCLFSPYPHCLIKAQDLTCFQSQPFLHSLSQSHASPLPLTFLHSLTPRLCLSQSHASSFSCFAAATLFLRNTVLLFFLSSEFLLHGFSGSLHLVLLFMLFIMWVCNKFKVSHSEGPKERFNNIKCLYHKQAKICCLGVSVFSLMLCLLNYLFFFFWLGHKLGPIP